MRRRRVQMPLGVSSVVVIRLIPHTLEWKKEVDVLPAATGVTGAGWHSMLQ